MEVFRLCREQYCQVLDGKDASLHGARWNSPGVELIYSAANRSLAMAELVVHLSLATLPEYFFMMTINIPDDLAISEINIIDLPDGWNFFPHIAASRRVGDKFVSDNTNCILKIPSAVTQGDFNYLINPHHPGFVYVKVSTVNKFPFDRRIFRS